MSLVKRILTKAEKRELQGKLQTEYLTGVWTTHHEAALRHGVTDSTIGRLMRRIKLCLDETLKEQREEEVSRTLLQIEATIGKAYEAFGISQRKKSRCKVCKGLGEDKDGDECDLCDGEGWIETVHPGDSRHLTVVLKALEQKSRIYAMQPERRGTNIRQQYNMIQGPGSFGEQNPLAGAPIELLLRANRLLLELEEGSGNGEVLDVEVKKKDEKETRL